METVLQMPELPSHDRGHNPGCGGGGLLWVGCGGRTCRQEGVPR